MATQELDSVLTKVLWSRLTSIVDEAATGLIRAAYSIVVRDYYDFSIGLFDASGTMLVHSTQSTPGFIGMMPNVMKHMLKRHPIETLKDGDVLVTNDCWITTGHTLDITVAAPIYDGKRLVGFSACTVHHLDIGDDARALIHSICMKRGCIFPSSRCMTAAAETTSSTSLFEPTFARLRRSLAT